MSPAEQTNLSSISHFPVGISDSTIIDCTQFKNMLNEFDIFKVYTAILAAQINKSSLVRSFTPTPKDLQSYLAYIVNVHSIGLEQLQLEAIRLLELHAIEKGYDNLVEQQERIEYLSNLVTTYPEQPIWSNHQHYLRDAILTAIEDEYYEELPFEQQFWLLYVKYTKRDLEELITLYEDSLFECY